MNEKSVKPTEQYEGPGKWVSGFGGWMSRMMIVVPIASIGTVPMMRHAEQFQLAGQEIPKLRHLKGFAVAATAFAIGIPVALYGAVKNWKKATAAEAQFNAMQVQRNESNIRTEALQAQVQSLNAEVSSYRKQFSEGMTPRTAGHADAVQADKAVAASVEATR